MEPTFALGNGTSRRKNRPALHAVGDDENAKGLSLFRALLRGFDSLQSHKADVSAAEPANRRCATGIDDSANRRTAPVAGNLPAF